MDTTIKYNRILRIVLVSTFLGFIYNAISDNGINIIRDETKLTTVNDSTLFLKSAKESSAAFKSITSKQAYKLYKLNEVVFIDARDKWDFTEAHIPGSINIPEYDYEPGNPISNTIDKNLRYVIYCDGNDCDVSIRLANKLKKSNFSNMLIYSGGWQAWIKNGYPIEKGIGK